jgi:ligand-binding sensor domain-containing protein
MRKLLYTLIVIGLWPLVAQAAIPEMKFRRLDTRNGLSNSQVNCVFRDSKGFVWIGTAYGLNRYDGYRVKVFYSNKRDTTTMRDNYTDQIMEAYDGKLWLKQGMNYSIYNPETEKVERNASRELERFFGFNAGVEYVYIDNKKNYWVKFYDKGIFCYNPHTKKYSQIKMGYGLGEFKPTYGISRFADYGDNVLVTTFNGELVSLDGEKGWVDWENKWMRENGGLQNQEYKLFVDNEGNFWICAERRSFVYIEAENRWYSSVVDYLRAKGLTDIPDDLQIWYVKVDHRGWIWIATDHQGLIVVDLKNKQWKQFTNSKIAESSISDNTLRNIYQDNNGNIWIGSFKNGVNQYVEGLASIRSLEIGDINTVCEDKHGNYWIGSNENGIIVYNPKTEELVSHYTTANSPMMSNIMVGSCCASDGSVWFGSYNGGLVHCIPSATDPQHATIVNYRSTGDPEGLSTNNVWSITEDKWHRIWIGTLGGGIQMLNLKTGKFKTWNVQNAKIPSDYMTSIGWIKKGWLMVGTTWYYCFVNPVTGKLANRVIPDDPNVTVNTANTVCVMEDSRGLIWQGSASGVCVYDQQRGQVYLLDMTSGMIGSSVCSVVEDKNHSMWVVTDHGISKITPQWQDDGRWQFVIRSYTARDGLKNVTYNQRSAYLTRSGLVLVGGQDGIDIIAPKGLSDATSKERPIFSGLQIFDEDVEVGKEIDGRVILDEALDECKSITLNFNDQFTIQLASDASKINNGKRFVYKLEGFNENWVKTSELNPNITYNSLRAGSYTLCVRMLNDDGTMGEVESQLDITIRPAIWRTRWAILLYLIVIALAALWWRRWYMKRQARQMDVINLRRETEKEQWMGEMRMKMAAEQPSAHKDEEKPKEETQLVLQTTDVVQLLRQICEDYQEKMGSRAKVTFLSTVKEIDVDIAKNEFIKAFHILMDNSVRFAPEECRMSIGIAKTDEGKVQIQVADNGIGIRDEYKVHAFDHLPGVDNVGLPIVKDVVVAHGGDIRMEDNPGGGTIFFITLPVAEEIEEAIVMED